MKKICVYIPTSHKEEVKSALFAAGAGKIGNYDCCSFETKGVGQYRPGAGSNPFQGEVDSIEALEEFKVELVCDEQFLKPAIKAMIKAHPYEEVAYQVFDCLTVDVS